MNARVAALALIVLSPVPAAPAAPHPRRDAGAIEEVVRASPEHRVVRIDARGPIDPADPRLEEARSLLGQADSIYEEDARRIAELTDELCRELRAEGHDASPLEILEGSLIWRDDDWFRAGKRRFELYAALYATVRLNAPPGRRGMSSHRRAIWILRSNPIPKWAEK